MAANRATDSLQGSVKELKTKIISSYEGEPERYEPPLRIVSYDQAGNKIQEALYQPDDSLVFKTVYIYDFARRLVEQLLYDANQSATSKTVFEYDSENRLIERKIFDLNGDLQVAQHPTYTAQGLRIEDETLPEAQADVNFLIEIEGTDFSISGNEIHRLRKVYDAAGKPLEISLFDKKNSRIGKILYAYDRKGRLIEMSQYDWRNFESGGEMIGWQRALKPLLLRLIKLFLFFKCVYGFGSRREIRKAFGCFLNGSLSLMTVYLYDQNGRVAEEQNYFFGSLEMKKTYAYDDKGDKAEETAHYIGEESFQQKQIFKREYDSHGNWIKEVAAYSSRMKDEIKQGEVVTYREISYYPY